MYLDILVTTTLFIATSAQELNMLHYINHNEESLIKCIENSEYLEGVKKLRGSEFIQAFAKFAAEKLAEQEDVDVEFLDSVIIVFKHEPHNFPSTSTGTFWNKELGFALRNALIHCSDDYNVQKCSDSNHVANRRLIPLYQSELADPEITRLVNLAAVSFPRNLRSLATTPYGFILLMTFADDFVIAIANAYRHSNSHANDLRLAVRDTWTYRLFESRCPLLRYYYEIKNREVYTCGCANQDKYKNNWRSLNQKATPKESSGVLRLFQSNLLEGRGDDVYNRYVAKGMRVYEREFEILMTPKYRIAIFIYELRVRGILTDQTALINQAFIDNIPEALLAILDNDEAYIEHLANIRNFLLSFLEFNHLEEEIILFLNSVVNFRYYRSVKHAKSLSYEFPIGRYVEYVSGTNSTINTNSTMTSTTTRPKGKESLHKDVKNWCIKYLDGNRFRNKNRKSSPDKNQGSNTMNSKIVGSYLEQNAECSNNETENYDEYYGYGTHKSLNLDLPGTIFLSDIFLSFGNSVLCMQSAF